MASYRFLYLERANTKSTVELWKKIKTFEDKKWTKKYHDPNPNKKVFWWKSIDQDEKWIKNC